MLFYFHEIDDMKNFCSVINIVIKYLLLHKIDGIRAIRVCVYTHMYSCMCIYTYRYSERERILKSIIKLYIEL